MSPERQRLIRLLFEEYIELYAARDTRLFTRFSENFGGFTGSSDQLVKTRAQWLDVLQRDFLQVPNRIGIEMVDLFVQDLGPDLLAATAFFHIHLPIPDASFAQETARKVVLFRREAADTLSIAHISVSIPFGKARDNEVYPVDALRQQNRDLQTQVQEHTQALAEVKLQLTLLSQTDGLTGLANRRHFDEALAREWARAQRSHTPLALILLDVDGFKAFNDHYGHLAGDACLQSLALTLTQVLAHREGDLVARFSGDKFIVLMPGAEELVAAALARQVLTTVRALQLTHHGAPSGVVTVSVGVSSVQPQRDESAETLVRMVDSALRRSKQSGRDRVEMAGKSEDEA